MYILSITYPRSEGETFDFDYFHQKHLPEVGRTFGPFGLVFASVLRGERTLNPLFSSWTPGSDDGKVSVRSARIPGADFLLVHHSHTWMAWSTDVNSAVVQFLRAGYFDQ